MAKKAVTPNLTRELIELTSALIHIPSTHSQPEEIGKCASFIETWLNSNSIQYRRLDIEEVPSILVLPENNHCNVALISHFDVVSGPLSLFQPHIDNGKLYGRGAIDDKYAVALSLLLFREHLYRLRKVGKSQNDMVFGLLLTGDEEVGGAKGCAHAINKFSTDFFIALDGGKPDVMITKEKGVMLLQMESQGKAAHAARPWLGTSGFDMLIQDYLAIKTLFPDVGQDDWSRTLVLSNCQAGNGATNVLPSHCRATLDVRYTDNDDPNELLRQIRQLAKSTITVKTQEPVFTSQPSPWFDLLKAHVPDGRTTFAHGASDARYFSSRNIPGVIWGADGELSHHSDNEYILLHSLYHFSSILDDYLTSCFSLMSGPLQSTSFHDLRN